MAFLYDILPRVLSHSENIPQNGDPGLTKIALLTIHLPQWLETNTQP